MVDLTLRTGAPGVYMRLSTIVLGLAVLSFATPALAHGGGLNGCGCHFDRKTGGCHCHRPGPCGCACDSCSGGYSGDGTESMFVPCVSTRGYTKKNGTYVAPHQRSNANRTKIDNYSTKGNTNPYTGKRGTKKL